MAKLDEIAELLTEELDGFNKSIEKLGKLTKKFQSTKIEADTSCIEYQIKKFLDSQRGVRNYYTAQINELNKTLYKSRSIPKWEPPIIYLLMGINILAFTYMGYHFIQFGKKKEAKFIKGREEGIDLVRGYFSDHPVIYRDFKKWAKKQDSISDQK